MGPGPARPAEAADAVVGGAGPAGCTAAILLAAAGWRVVVLGRPPAGGDRIGESLSPGAPAILERLGLGARFLADGHLRCHANASAWGSPELAWHDFLLDPRGPGFHIDRARFEALLRARAAEAGAHLVTAAAPRGVVRAAGIWHVPATAASPPLAARYLIDASGRAARLARELGARREVAWEQVALVAFARAARPCAETFTLVESVSEGFWYSAPIPDGRFALALFTDAALGRGAARTARTPAGLRALLAGAPRTRDRLEAHGAALEGTPRFVDAGSTRLTPAHGPGWIAAGDAALAYDPISAHGLTLALRTSADAAAALLADAGGDAAALPAYSARLARAFDDYRREALRIFRAEQRWPAAPYWRKRHALR